MQITEKDYKRWFKFAKVITNDEYMAEEVMQDVMVKMILKMEAMPDFEMNDNFVFISLKNHYINSNKKEDKRQEFERNFEMIEYDDYDEDKITRDADEDLRKKIVEEIALKLDFFDKQLYILYFVRGMSYRKIAAETDISHMVIFNRMKIIKDSINNEYEKRKQKNQEQKNK